MKKYLMFVITSFTYGAMFECPVDENLSECEALAFKSCGNQVVKEKLDNGNIKFSCHDKSKITENEKKVEKEEQVEQEKSYVDSSFSGWKPLIGFGFSGGATVESSLRVYDRDDGNTYRGDVEFETDSTFNISFEMRSLNRNGWGVSLGLEYDFKREVESGVIRLGNSTVNVSSSGNPDQYSTTTIYYNFIYMWESVYIPFGFNISSIDYESGGTEIEASSGLGVQFGVGVFVNNNFAIEFIARGIAFELEYTVDNLDVFFEEGVAADVGIRLRYVL